MKQQLLLPLCLLAMGANAQMPVFNPSMPVTPYGYVDSPFNEDYTKIIDGDSETKFLDFGYFDGMGFTVDIGTGGTVVPTAIEVTTANDSEERDPMNFEISGSMNGTDFSFIATGTIPCIPDRFTTRSFPFTNNTFYQYYRINFSNQCNTIEAMLQLSEVQLTGTVLSMQQPVLTANSVQVFPNPANGYFTVQSNNGIKISSIRISDALGKIVRQVNVTAAADQFPVDIQDLGTGVYFATVEAEGSRVIKKLVVN